MKLGCVILVLGGAFLSGCVGAPAAGPVPWTPSIPLGIERAEGNQVLFVYFHAEWCRVCTQMDERVFPTAAVHEALAPYVPVKIDVDEQPGVAEAYLATVTPAYMLIDQQGAVRARSVGLMTTAELVHFLDESARLLEAEHGVAVSATDS